MNTRHDAFADGVKKAARLRGGWSALTALYVAAIIASCLCFTSSSNGAQQTSMRQWQIESNPETNHLDMALRYGAATKSFGAKLSHNTNSFRISLDRLQGLTASQIASGGARVKFRLVRDAGTFDCEGWFKEGRGSGSFVFSANPNFVPELGRRGIDRPTDEQQFYLAAHDVGLELIDELRAQGYDQPTPAQLVRLGTHGVRLDYVRELKSLGQQVKSIDLLIGMVDHGVSISFVGDLVAAGYAGVSPEQLIRAADHGVNSSFIKEFSTLGYERVPLETLVRMNDRGVTPKFIKELEVVGYSRIPVDQLIRMRDTGVTASFIQKAKNLRLNDLTVEELIKLRNQGVID